MNVLNGRDIDKVVVLGSGLSILSLTAEEIAYINRCKTVVAVNKFMAFYKKSKILPTHVYFTDKLDNSFEFYKYILRVCVEDDLEDLTFVTNKYNYHVRYVSFLSMLKAGIVLNSYKLRYLAKKIIKPKKMTAADYGRLNQKIWGLKYPKKSKVIAVKIPAYMTGGAWATSFNQTLFHFRGSLTSVLNVCSILAPNCEIFLVGNDFNGSSYFYEAELEQLDFHWKDFTYDLVKEKGTHFSFHEVNGTKMEDAFPVIEESLKRTGNELFCTNPHSLLVTSAGVRYKSILGGNG